MTHATSDFIIAICAVLGTVAAFIGPVLMRSDVKRSMAESWGKISQTVENHGERLDKHDEKFERTDEKLQDHGERLAAGHL